MKKEDYVYQVFQRIAPDYDKANARISLGMHLRWKRYAVNTLLRAVPISGRVLDLCCGTGDMSALLVAGRRDIRVTGIDFSPNMLAVAQQRLLGQSRVTLLRGDAMALDLPDEQFDAAVISFALRNTSDFRRVLFELFRVLKPGGQLCVIDSFRPEKHLIRPFYSFYFSVLMPLLGGGIRKHTEYEWLNRSTKAFLSPTALAALMQQMGFELSNREDFMCSACVCLIVRKC